MTIHDNPKSITNKIIGIIIFIREYKAFLFSLIILLQFSHVAFTAQFNIIDAVVIFTLYSLADTCYWIYSGKMTFNKILIVVFLFILLMKNVT